MQITGKIIAVLPSKSGVSQRTGNSWMTQEYVIETHEQYPKKCCFSVFGQEKIQNLNIQLGEEMTVSFDIDAKEHNGRWFNEVRAYAIDRINQQQSVRPMPQPQQTPQPQIPSGYQQPSSSDDCLPF